MENVLYYGDNLDILKRYVKDESVDLIYLDPPFNSNANYNVLFAEKNGTQAASQIRAFTDTWTWDQEDESVFAELVTKGGKVADVLQAFRTFLGPCDLLAYLVMMAPRLIELRRTLKATGSIYLHCDPTASHYLKLLMDAIFGIQHFRNEIVWHYRRWTAPSKKFQRLHDIILFYTKGNTYIFNQLLTPYTKGSVERKEQGILHRFKKGEEPVLVSDGKLQADGVAENDVWHIPFIAPSAKERLGYPTQKPKALLERIISASSNQGDIVLDPFCGCGTTVDAAQGLGRKWIGIDITHIAINLIRRRLIDSYGGGAGVEVIGEPKSVADAEVLAASEPYQFQWWALGLIGARPVEEKKGADKGIDGKIIFQGDTVGKFETVIISVKAGKTGSAHIRDLKGVLDRDKAAIGVLISMKATTRDMRTEAVTAGFYKSLSYGQFPRVQLLTIADLLSGKKIEMPPIRQVNASFKKAPKVEEPLKKQKNLF
ncbi:MAG: DNA methyltransferase [Candidatus Omnitrophota bacterium]|jgi:DNA modification methylase